MHEQLVSRRKVSRLDDPRIQRILTPAGRQTSEWRDALDRFNAGDVTLTRRSAGEAAIKAVQRMLIFLGYSTSSTGAFVIDGDFGRGTNRGLAQFQFEHGLSRRSTNWVLFWAAVLIATAPWLSGITMTSEGFAASLMRLPQWESAEAVWRQLAPWAIVLALLVWQSTAYAKRRIRKATNKFWRNVFRQA